MPLPPPIEMNDAYGEFDLPGGRVIVPRHMFASYGVKANLHPEVTDTSPVADVPAVTDPNAPGMDSRSMPASPIPASPAPLTPPPGAAPVAVPTPAQGQSGAAPSWMTERTDPLAPPAGLEQFAPPPPAEPPPDFKHVTEGDVYAQKEAANKDAAKAEGAISKTQAEGLAEQARLLDARNAEADAERKRWADREAANQKAIEDTTSFYKQKVQEFADKKVDRRGFSVMEMIGAAMAGLGSAMKGEGDKNPALDFALAKIDKAYEDGLRERDQLGKQVGLAHDAIEMAQTAATSDQARKKVALSAIQDKTAGYIEATVAKFGSKEKQLEPLKLAAALRVESAKNLAEGVKNQTAKDQAAAELAQREAASKRSAYVDMRGQDKLDLRERDRWKFDLDAAEKARQVRLAEATTAEEKEAIEREVPDLYQVKLGPDGKPVLGPDGQPVRQIYQAANKEVRNKVAGIKAAHDALTANLKAAIRIRNDPHFKNFGAFKNTEDYQTMTTLVQDIGVQYTRLYDLGAYDAGIERAAKAVMGGDPKSGFNAEDAVKQLWKNTNPTAGFEAMRKSVNGRLNYFANTERYSRAGEYIPVELDRAQLDTPLKTANDEKVEKLINAPTPAEIRKAGEPGPIAKAANTVFGALDPVFGVGERKTNAQVAAEEAAAAASDPTGRVNKIQETEIKNYSKQLKGTDPEAAAMARKSLVTLALNDKRPELASYTMEALAKAGDDQSLGEIEAKLRNDALQRGATTQREVDAAAAPVAQARQVAALEKQNDNAVMKVKMMAQAAAEGNPNAATGLMNLQNDPTATAAERFAAHEAIRKLSQARAGISKLAPRPSEPRRPEPNDTESRADRKK